MTGATVLIVDDDPDLRDVICTALQDEGAQCTAVAGGAEALARLRDGLQADAIILDLMMPEMDGWTFRRLQQADPRLASIPVLVLSASRHLESSIVAQGFLRKPMELDALMAAVRAVLGR